MTLDVYILHISDLLCTGVVQELFKIAIIRRRIAYIDVSVMWVTNTLDNKGVVRTYYSHCWFFVRIYARTN